MWKVWRVSVFVILALSQFSITAAHESEVGDTRWIPISEKNTVLIESKKNVLEEILRVFLLEALWPPENLEACAQEILMRGVDKVCGDPYAHYFAGEKILQKLDQWIRGNQYSTAARISSWYFPVGILTIFEFPESTPKRCHDAFKHFRDNGIFDVIVNLQNNPGGNVESALLCLALFMGPEDTVMTTRERGGRLTKYNRSNIADFFQTDSEKRIVQEFDFGAFRDMRIVVLINRDTASAAELFAGVMKDWGYPIIGERSYGKGVAGEIFRLSDGSKLLVTKFEVFAGNKMTSIHTVGVEPTIQVLLTKDAKEDPFMRMAIEILRKLSGRKKEE